MLYVIASILGVAAGIAGLYVEPHLLRLRSRRADAESEIEGTGPAAQPFSLPGWNSPQTYLLPLLLGAVFGLLAWRYGWGGNGRDELLLACLYSAILFLIAVIDFHTRLVLNILSYPAGAIGLAGAGLWTGIGFGSALLGGAVALVLFFVIEIIGRGAMGRGDTKLATVIGLMRGFPTVWQALVLGIVTGGVFAVGLLVSGRGRRTTFAYGPALAIGAVISMLLTAK